MSEFELFSKSLARAIFIQNKTTSLTSAGIRRGYTSPSLQNIVSKFKSSSLDLHVLELQEHDIDDLIFKLRTFCKDNALIFILAYLQIVPVKESGNIEYTADVIWSLQLFSRQ